MDTEEREVHAHQHKDRVELNERHTNIWGKFQNRRDEYAQKYGSAYADILLRQEKGTLEAQFNQDHLELSEQHDQQWLAYHETPSSPQPPSPVLPETKLALELAENATKNNDEKTVPSSGDQARQTLFANPFKQVEPEQKQESTSQPKNIDQSQDYMKAMLSTQKTNPAKEKEVENDKKPVSMSTRFSQGLSYTRATEQTSRSIERSKDIDKD